MQIEQSAVSKSTPDALPRIWWIGTGLGSSMPFHAAGVHSPGSTENAFSKAVSSYTPSIKTLGYAHRRVRITESTQVSLLIATMPTTPVDALHPDAGKPCDLPGVVIETKHVTELVEGKIPVQSLNSPSVAQVIDKMRDCSLAHFACHGSTDLADPSNSGLILQRQDDQGLKQDRLTVRRVSELSLAGARQRKQGGAAVRRGDPRGDWVPGGRVPACGGMPVAVNRQDLRGSCRRVLSVIVQAAEGGDLLDQQVRTKDSVAMCT